MKKFFSFLLFACAYISVHAQEYFTITQYDVAVHVNKDASLDVDETIHVHFTEPRHGIIRLIPYKYPLQQLPAGTEKANRQLESGGYAHTMIENLKVDEWEYDVSTEGDYKSIKIGSGDKTVDGDQVYAIHYRMLNAINFFDSHAELYFNVIGDRWETTIDSVNFSVSFYDALPGTPEYFVATGATGSRENNTAANWPDGKTFAGHTTKGLGYHEGLTVGIVIPKDFLVRQNYNLIGIWWLLLPVGVFASMLAAWRKWGKDEKPVVQTEFYPPGDVSPSISGYIIDDRLDRRDLTALVPYWGAGGYLKITETEKKSLLGIVKSKEYIFTKVKELPSDAPIFERTLFNGIFATGSNVALRDLKNVLYVTMNKARMQIVKEIDRGAFYVKGSAGLGCAFIGAGVLLLAAGIFVLIAGWVGSLWCGIGCIAGAVIIFIFGALMRKKTEKGTALLQKLLGFREFIKSVEKDRLAEFLKQDEHYFDKILPYAIVFGIADTWKDKLQGLDIPPPQWYSGNYTAFNIAVFMNSLNNSMNQMSDTFYSAPSSSGSSGGSFSSGGGGFSGGGFGGGGGSSW